MDTLLMRNPDTTYRTAEEAGDQSTVAYRVAEQIAHNAKSRGLTRDQMTAWVSLICRMAMGIYDVDGKLYDKKLTFKECRRRKQAVKQ